MHALARLGQHGGGGHRGQRLPFAGLHLDDATGEQRLRATNLRREKGEA